MSSIQHSCENLSSSARRRQKTWIKRWPVVVAIAATGGIVLTTISAPSLFGSSAEASPISSATAFSAEVEDVAPDISVDDMAVTETEMEEVVTPEGYGDTLAVMEEEVDESRALIAPIDSGEGEEAPRDASGDVGEERTIAHAPISSPSAIVGVAFPTDIPRDDTTFSYRTLSEGVWSQWTDFELVEPRGEDNEAGTAIAGSEPITVIDAQEIEVIARTKDGESLPGAVLNVIEPEREETAAEENSENSQEAQSSDTETPESGEEAQADDSPANENDVPLDQTAEDTVGEDVHDAEGSDASEPSLLVPDTISGGQGRGNATCLAVTGVSPDGKKYHTGFQGLTITTRKGWGANESLMSWDLESVTFKGAVIHHTAGSNNYRRDQVPALVRGIYRYHAVTLGWGDVGYHLLVDKYGGVWEGRAGGLTRAYEGGHAYGANSATFGVSVLGNFQSARPTDAAIDAVAKAVAWKLKTHGITSIDSTFTVRGNKSGYSSVTLPVVAGHRHVGGTACPGEELAKRIPNVRQKVKNFLASSSGSPAQQDEGETRGTWAAPRQIGQGWQVGQLLAAGGFSSPHNTDALLIDKKGLLWLYPGKNDSQFSDRKQIGHAWNMLDSINSGFDFDGDGHTDIVGRVKKTGDLRLYSGDGKGGFKTVKRIGWGWQKFSQIKVLDSADRVGPTVFAVGKYTGRLLAYTTDGQGNFLKRNFMGFGWNNMRDLNTVGDRDGDGFADLISVDSRGKMWLYSGHGDGTVGGRIQIGQGWGSYAPIVATGNQGSLWTVDSRGKLWLYVLTGVRK